MKSDSLSEQHQEANPEPEVSPVGHEQPAGPAAGWTGMSSQRSVNQCWRFGLMATLLEPQSSFWTVGRPVGDQSSEQTGKH